MLSFSGMETQIGQITSASTHTGYCRLTPLVSQGSVVYFKQGEKKISCRVVYMYNSPYKGIIGNITFLDPVQRPPRVSTPLYMDGSTKKEPGVYIEIGRDPFDQPVHVRVNALFRNVLIAGKTQSGKTHAMLVLSEEFVRLRIPHLIFDTQDEFTGLKEKFGDAIAFESNPRKLLQVLKERRTVIVSLMGLSVADKAEIVGATIKAVFKAKERSYKTNPRRYPPIVVTIDETELYAPANYSVVPDKYCRKSLEDVVKRGVKFGLGTILIAQRPPMLDPDIRSQCNSALIFILDDTGSINAIKRLGFITPFDIELIRRLQQGECMITGAIVPKPVKAKIKEISVHRTKNVNFEQLLDLQVDLPEEPVRAIGAQLALASDGEEVDKYTGESKGWQFDSRMNKRYGPR